MFLGMRGNDDWVNDQRPMNWRQQIMYLYPNGMVRNRQLLVELLTESTLLLT